MVDNVSMRLKFCFVIYLILFVPNLFADKIGTLQNEIKSQCGKKTFPKQKIIYLVRRAYLSCHAGEKIEIESGCVIRCLKENVGNIIARRRRF